MSDKLIPVKLQYTYNGYFVEIDNQGDNGYWWVVRLWDDNRRCLHRQYAFVKTLDKAKADAIADIECHMEQQT